MRREWVGEGDINERASISTTNRHTVGQVTHLTNYQIRNSYILLYTFKQLLDILYIQIDRQIHIDTIIYIFECHTHTHTWVELKVYKHTHTNMNTTNGFLAFLNVTNRI